MPNITYYLPFAVKAFDEISFLPGVFVFTALFGVTFAVFYAYEYYWLHRDDATFTFERYAQAQIDPDAWKTTERDKAGNLLSAVALGIFSLAIGLFGSFIFATFAIQMILDGVK